MKIPKKKNLRIKPLYDPEIPLLGIYLDGIKIEKDICTSMFIAALFTKARTCKSPNIAFQYSRCTSTDEWIKL